MTTTNPPSVSDQLDGDDFERAFGEPIRRILDLATWSNGEDLNALYRRLEREVGAALTDEDRLRARIRTFVLPKIATRERALPNAGIFRVTTHQVAAVHRGLLFTGAVEACDGAVALIDTLPVTIAQIGVGLVSYRGDQGTWLQRLFRRDLRIGDGEPVDQLVLELLQQRHQRGGLSQESERDTLTRLARRGLMTYAERAALAQRSTARWRLGHGAPAPLELLTGSGSPDMLRASLDVLSALIADHRRFLFVPSEPEERLLLTIGEALRPLEFAIIESARDRLSRLTEVTSYIGPELTRQVRAFVNDIGRQIGVGVYRASAAAPPHLFYGHVEHMHEAGLIAIADSVLQEHRGFPLLIDIADTICRVAFGAETFGAAAQAVYAGHGAPFRHWSERQSRDQGGA